MVVGKRLQARILRLRRDGYRLWRIAADTGLPQHVVYGVLVRNGGVQRMQLDHRYEVEKAGEVADFFEPVRFAWSKQRYHNKARIGLLEKNLGRS